MCAKFRFMAKAVIQSFVKVATGMFCYRFSVFILTESEKKTCVEAH